MFKTRVIWLVFQSRNKWVYTGFWCKSTIRYNLSFQNNFIPYLYNDSFFSLHFKFQNERSSTIKPNNLHRQEFIQSSWFSWEVAGLTFSFFSFRIVTKEKYVHSLLRILDHGNLHGITLAEWHGKAYRQCRDFDAFMEFHCSLIFTAQSTARR